jgi:hypothetical protein
MKTRPRYLALFAAPMLVISTFAQDAYVYPTKTQTPEQIAKDKSDCAAWAKQQTGYDPSQPTTVVAPPPQQGQVAQGAGRGAAIGAMGGAIGGNAGKGAAIGAASGALLGGVRKRNDAQAQEAQNAAAVNQVRSSYDRAYKACLEGKGYTVK